MKINLPKPIFDHIEVNRENLVAKVQVSDVLDSNNIGTWFNNDNIADMLEIVVAKVKTSEARGVVSSFPQIVDPDSTYKMAQESIGISREDYERVRLNIVVHKKSLNHSYVGS